MKTLILDFRGNTVLGDFIDTYAQIHLSATLRIGSRWDSEDTVTPLSDGPLLKASHIR